MNASINGAGAFFKLSINTNDLAVQLQAAAGAFSAFSRSGERSFKRITDASGQASDSLENDQEKIRTSAKQTATTFSSMFAALGGYDLAKRAVRELWRSVIGYGSSLEDASLKTGLSVETLSSWSLAANRAGASLEGIATAAKSLNLTAAEGLGVQILDSDSLEERFKKVVSALQGIKDPAERAQKAAEAFGDSAKDLAGLLDQGNGAFDEAIEKAREYGYAMSDDAAESSKKLKEEIELLKDSALNIARAIGASVVPLLADAASVAAAFVGAIQDHRAEVNALVAALAAIAAYKSIGAVAVKVKAFSVALKGAALAAKTAAITFARMGATLMTTRIAFTKGAEGAKKQTAALYSLQGAAMAAKVALGGLGIAIGVLSFIQWLSEGKRHAAELSEEMGNIYENGNDLRRLAQTKFAFLEQIANQSGLAAEAFDKATKYVIDLQNRYGDLGVTVDATGKRIEMAADAQERFNKAVIAESAEQLKKKIREEEENLRELNKEQQGNFDYYNSVGARFEANYRALGSWATGGRIKSAGDKWAKEVDETGKKIRDKSEELRELRERLKKIQEGDVDAALGKTEEEVAQEAAGAAEAAAKQIEDLDKKIADAETKARRASQTRVQNAIEDARAEEAAYVEALKARLALEKAKPDAERDEEAVKSLNKRIEESSERISVVVDKINSEEFQKLQEQIERTEDKISGAVESEVARRVAEIDKETEAYRKLLEAAKEVADEEKKRELETKLQGLDAAAKERKDAIYDEQIAKTPTEALINLEKSLASAIKDAMADGALSGSEREKIAKAREEYEAQKRNDEFEKTTQRYDDALEKLRLAADKLATMSDDMFDNYDKEERALASEEYARAADELAEASAALADFGQNEEESRADMVDAINAATDDSTKEFISCITTSNADASQAAMKASLGVQSRLDLGNQYADITADATNSVDRMIANSGGTFGNIERLLTGILNKGGQAQFG